MTCDFDGKLDLGEFLKTNPRVLELILHTPLIPGGSSIVHQIRMKFGESETNKISTSKIISELQSLVSPPSAMDVFITITKKLKDLNDLHFPRRLINSECIRGHRSQIWSA